MQDSPSRAEKAHVPGTARNQASPRPLLWLVGLAAVLYYAREIAIPLALAAVLALILTPVASRTERWLGRVGGALLSLFIALVVVAAVGYFLSIQLTQLVKQSSIYSANISRKVIDLEDHAPQALKHLWELLHRSEGATNSASPGGYVPLVQTLPPRESLLEQITPTLPFFYGVFETLLVIVLMFFMLYERNRLRDRMVRLAARARITLAAQAIETAGETISRYLLLYTLINIAYGVAVGITCWLVGLPQPQLWGVLSALLRYIPYIGAITSSVLPTLLAVAVFPGWSRALELFAAVVFYDQIAAQFVEPFLIGKGVGVEPMALLLSALFWSWLWGPVGLLLSTPFAVCLKVAGDYIPSLSLFSLLLGSETTVADYQDYYRALLELDRRRAGHMAARYCDEFGLEATFHDLLLPALELAESEREHDHISSSIRELIEQAIAELVMELGDRYRQPRVAGRVRIMTMCPPGDPGSIPLLMALQLIRADGFAGVLAGQNKTITELRESAAHYGPDLVCLWCSAEINLPSTVELIQVLGETTPAPTIIAVTPTNQRMAAALRAAGCHQVALNFGGLRALVRRLVGRQLRERRVLSGIAGAQRPATAESASAWRHS